jgi:hypothetical protein
VPAENGPAFDRNALLTWVGDCALLKELTDLFLNQAPQLLEDGRGTMGAH